ncbi:MAG: hypothetical protein KGQ59_08725 [Bdellovibrionales bacterium]|nr:hypothetical protein [Bdellovibrionales bacterium]
MIRHKKMRLFGGFALIVAGLVALRFLEQKSPIPALDAVRNPATAPVSTGSPVVSKIAKEGALPANQNHVQGAVSESEAIASWGRPVERVPTNSEIRRFKFGGEVMSYQRGWRLVKNAVAVAVEDRKLGESVGTEVATKGNFVFFQIKGELSRRSPGMKQVVYHRDHKKLGVLTGTMVVKVLRYETSDRLARDHGLDLVHGEEAINALFLSMAEGDPLSKVEELKKDARVVRAHLEILSDTAVRM